MRKRLLRPENVCLQIIDVQQSLMSKVAGADRVTSTIEFMIRCAKILEIPILANTQYKKGLGGYVAPVEALVGDLVQIDKTEFNATQNSETESYLDTLAGDVDTVILVGVETHICIYQTAMGLLTKGLDVWVVSDAVSSRKNEDHQAGIERMQSMGVSLGPAEMLIYELLGKAGSPEFKQILPLIIARDEEY